MHSERLPKKAALYAINQRSSWYAEWHELALWCEMSLDLDFGNVNDCRVKLYKLIATVDEKLRSRCIEEASNSTHRLIYKHLNYNLGPNNYFRDENSVEVISMMLRLRGELMHLNYIPHREDRPGQCSLCNQREREDVFHFLGRCPVLVESRRFFLGSNYLTEEEMISLLNEMMVEKLFTYCKVAKSYRDRILCESF